MLYEYLDPQTMHLRDPTNMSDCYSIEQSYGVQANVAHEARQLLMEWQAEDGVDSHKTGLQDPPLLALEVEAAEAELTILKRMFADSTAADSQAEESATELLKACVHTLARFESPQSQMPTPGQKVCLSFQLSHRSIWHRNPTRNQNRRKRNKRPDPLV